MYDYLIVGSGLFGATFARLATDAGKSCLVIDQRNHVGGNVYTDNHDGIHVHKYGPHIFHTSNKGIWDFVNKHTPFNNYQHKVRAVYKEKLYTLSFNLQTRSEVEGRLVSPKEKLFYGMGQFPEANNLEEWAINQLGQDMYDILIKGYTQKQWGRDPKDLPASIIKRLPIRNTYDDNYYNDIYQGIPEKGYTDLINNLLKNVTIMTGVKYGPEWASRAKKIIYTGPIDEFFDYEYGRLEYRSLYFDHQTHEGTYQGCAQVNYTGLELPITRRIEHKHFTHWKNPDHFKHTIITNEYPTKAGDPYYPINDDKNKALYKKYLKKANTTLPNVLFRGRLGTYQYYDMDQVIGQAMKTAKEESLC